MTAADRFRAVALWAALSVAAPSAAADPQESYERGMEAYNRQDVMAAMQHLGRAAEQGHVQAQVWLGYILDVANQDADSVTWYRRAAEQGDALGQFFLGKMYAGGEGLQTDLDAALMWFRRSAEGGYPEAMGVIAEAYEKGALGLEADLESARDWWLKAAEAGLGPAMDRLAAAHRRGELGFPVNPELANEWEQRRLSAAQSGAGGPDVPGGAAQD